MTPKGTVHIRVHSHIRSHSHYPTVEINAKTMTRTRLISKEKSVYFRTLGYITELDSYMCKLGKSWSTSYTERLKFQILETTFARWPIWWPIISCLNLLFCILVKKWELMNIRIPMVVTIFHLLRYLFSGSLWNNTLDCLGFFLRHCSLLFSVDCAALPGSLHDGLPLHYNAIQGLRTRLLRPMLQIDLSYFLQYQFHTSHGHSHSHGGGRRTTTWCYQEGRCYHERVKWQ